MGLIDDLPYVDKTRVAAALKAEYEERLSPLLDNQTLNDAAIADGIVTMIVNGEIN
ncbi:MULTISPECIES: hypothetical protein [Sporomusa]|jgi:hypothetical protein|uniref:hypothetical protein n=1 Tax=Sporomusa TaxID=2375 RepID=UPI002BB59D6A|nr:hypothetical protein [Sporomusa sphaeroides]HML32222.1 hypothetical protein [Sporomusa sphaeroides]